MKSLKFLFISLAIVLMTSCNSNKSKSPKVSDKTNTIAIWYGKQQTFGKIGNPQKWVNILGNVAGSDSLSSSYAILNDSIKLILSVGQDNHRLGRKGDFNVEIDRNSLNVGVNSISIYVNFNNGFKDSSQVTIQYYDHNKWPLPYYIDWKKTKNIADVVQIIDGKWELTEGGIRVKEPYYDRVLAFGDETWHNYEISTTVTFHDFASPLFEPPTYGVSHAAIAFRWPGHNTDKNQPHLKWYPLGATCEFKLFDNLDTCRFRILGGRKKANENAFRKQPITLNKKYHMKARAITIKDKSYYGAKLWPFGTKEHEGWDIISTEGLETDILFGSGLLLSHNTDVTFGNVSITEVLELKPLLSAENSN